MASPSNDPLLSSSSNPSRTRRACKFTLSIATLISLTALITLQLSNYYINPNQQIQPQPSDLCTRSPNPTTCHSIVSDALGGGGGPRPSTPLSVFRTILDKSLVNLAAAISAVNDLQPPNQHSPLADCLHLMDLSHHHLTEAGVDHSNARTLMSAVLTNYDTCIDGLDGTPQQSTLRSHIEPLMSLASASLAVLNSVDAADEPPNINVRFPSWVSHRDRKLLEVTSAKGIQANVVVAQDGSGKYRTVQEAVTAAPSKGSSRYVIYVKKGVYKEKVNIGKDKTNLMIVGDGMAATVITGSLNVVDGQTTFNSATVAAVGDGLILQDLKIENTAGAIKHQAVALRVGADRSVINRCSIEAYQDTLYAYSLRQFYRDCTVSGTVDFIFGNAAVVFQNCNLIARKPMANQQNLVTAQGRIDPNQNTGTSIQNCQVVPASDLAPTASATPTYLGRPWKQYSRTVFMQSFIGAHIDPKGWLAWDGDFALSTLFYGEYQNRGPGAGTGGRVNWGGYRVITDAKTAQTFTVAGLIQGGSWLQATGVSFTEGLDV